MSQDNLAKVVNDLIKCIQAITNDLEIDNIELRKETLRSLEERLKRLFDFL